MKFKLSITKFVAKLNLVNWYTYAKSFFVLADLIFRVQKPLVATTQNKKILGQQTRKEQVKAIAQSCIIYNVIFFVSSPATVSYKSSKYV